MSLYVLPDPAEARQIVSCDIDSGYFVLDKGNKYFITWHKNKKAGTDPAFLMIIGFGFYFFKTSTVENGPNVPSFLSARTINL